jgi:hypothetical protein
VVVGRIADRLVWLPEIRYDLVFCERRTRYDHHQLSSANSPDTTMCSQEKLARHGTWILETKTKETGHTVQPKFPLIVSSPEQVFLA